MTRASPRGGVGTIAVSTPSRRVSVAVVSIVVLAVVAAGMVVVGVVSVPSSPGRPCPPLGQPAATGTAPLPPSEPRSIDIEGIHACSSLVPVGVDARRRIEVPPVSAPEQAAWYRYGPTPGQRGPAVVVGHVNGNGREGVFADLDDVVRGDRISVARRDGTTAFFQVTGTTQVPKDAFPTTAIYGGTPDAQLRLITCGGALDRTRHDYADNVVVFAAYIGYR